MSRKFEVVSDTFDPESDPTYSTLEALSVEELLFVATKHQDEEIVEELARRGYDFKRASDDAHDYANRMMFGTHTEEKDFDPSHVVSETSAKRNSTEGVGKGEGAPGEGEGSESTTGFKKTSRELKDGLVVSEITGPGSNKYETGVRRKEDGSLETYVTDIDGNYVAVDVGSDADIDEFNGVSDFYADGIVKQDEVGKALLGLLAVEGAPGEG